MICSGIQTVCIRGVITRVCVCITGEYHAPTSPQTPGKEQDSVPTRRCSDVKLRGRKRVNDPVPPLDSDIEVQMRLHGVPYTISFINIFLPHTTGIYFHIQQTCFAIMSGNNAREMDHVFKGTVHWKKFIFSFSKPV